MPITQSRMIALINAANDYKSALKTILDSIRTLADDISQSKTTPAAAFQYLEAMASTRSLLSRPSASPSTIALEHYHFARNHRRNSRVANQQAASRRAAGIQPRTPSDFPYQTTDLYGFTPPKPTQPPTQFSPTQLRNLPDHILAAIAEGSSFEPSDDDELLPTGETASEARTRFDAEDDDFAQQLLHEDNKETNQDNNKEPNQC